MPCYNPLEAYFSAEVNPSGKRNIVFDPRKAIDDQSFKLACGQCIGCRLEKSRQWAIRCMHEASLYEDNCFITLTYAPDHLPPCGSLYLPHFQKFLKRLRFSLGSKKIRFYHCGEYGEKKLRPHYHALIFNHDFNDKEIIGENHLGQPRYHSEKLAKLWPHGRTELGSLTFESAAYVARYVTKKQNGEAAIHTYHLLDDKGEILQERTPEYATMSRRPGIGAPWLHKFQTDIYPDDFVVVRGKKCRVPKFYDSHLYKNDPFLFDDIKERRGTNSKKHNPNNTPERLSVRERLKHLITKQLKRNIENDT